MKSYSSIIRPLITEKSSAQQAQGEYTFELTSSKITKIDIKKAVEQIYGVKVKSVRTMIRPAKKRSVGRRVMLKRKPTKIALVTLTDKATIDPNKISKSKSKPKPTKKN